MALIKCPECNGIVSDVAFSCPHCGFPLKKDSQEVIEGKKYDEYIEIIETSIKAKNFNEALLFCNKAIEINPRKKDAWILKAIININLADPKESRLETITACFLRAYASEPIDSRNEFKNQICCKMANTIISLIDTLCKGIWSGKYGTEEMKKFLKDMNEAEISFLVENFSIKIDNEDLTLYAYKKIFNVIKLRWDTMRDRVNYLYLKGQDELEIFLLEFVYVNDYLCYIVNFCDHLGYLELSLKMYNLICECIDCFLHYGIFWNDGSLNYQREDDLQKKYSKKYDEYINKLNVIRLRLEENKMR